MWNFSIDSCQEHLKSRVLETEDEKKQLFSIFYFLLPVTDDFQSIWVVFSTDQSFKIQLSSVTFALN